MGLETDSVLSCSAIGLMLRGRFDGTFGSIATVSFGISADKWAIALDRTIWVAVVERCGLLWW